MDCRTLEVLIFNLAVSQFNLQADFLVCIHVSPSSFSAANLINSSYDDTAKACAIVETASSNEISVIDNEDNHAFISSSVDRSEYGAPGEIERKKEENKLR